MSGERSPFGYNLSRVMVLDKIKKALGLNNIDKMFYGAAPLKEDTSDFFASLNMPITSIFGLTETSGAVTYQEFPNIKFNQNGKPLPGTSLKIFNADIDGIGEICVKGRNVFMGYLGQEQENLDAFDVEGYFHTGDIGLINEDGRL
jgi:long-subunit acyl-CoA synthetase (AMP-forming)